MISFLKGDFIVKGPASVVIDVNGIGYEVLISLNTYSKIQHLDKGQLHTSLLIREDAHTLYGFFDLSEREMFLQLINVSGIGASTARMMLSYMKPDELARAIMFLTNFDDTIVCRFGKLELVRNQWRKFNFNLDTTGNYTNLPANDPVSTNVLAVNIEENDSREPIPYRIPPGIERQQELSNNNVE